MHKLIKMNLQLFLSTEDEKKIQEYKAAYDIAKANNDTAGMEAAHAGAEAVRANYGYSGGDDGSQNISISGGSSGGSTKRSSGGVSYDTSTDYTALLNNYMNSGSTDTALLQSLLNSRIAKETDPEYSQYANSAFNTQVQNYINGIISQNQNNALLDEIKALRNTASPTYEKTDMDYLAETLANAALNMQYDDWLNSDQYKALANRYNLQGNQSMNNVLGQVASRTGGLASSYATTAAQQQYNDFMSTLEEAAYNLYGNEQNSALTKANAAMNYADNDYQRYLNELSQWNTDKSFAYDTLVNAINQSNYANEWNYQTSQNDKSEAQQRIQNYLGTGGSISGLSSDLINASGYTDAELQQMVNSYQSSQSNNSGKSDTTDYYLNYVKTWGKEDIYTEDEFNQIKNNRNTEKYRDVKDYATYADYVKAKDRQNQIINATYTAPEEPEADTENFDQKTYSSAVEMIENGKKNSALSAIYGASANNTEWNNYINALKADGLITEADITAFLNSRGIK